MFHLTLFYKRLHFTSHIVICNKGQKALTSIQIISKLLILKLFKFFIHEYFTIETNANLQWVIRLNVAYIIVIKGKLYESSLQSAGPVVTTGRQSATEGYSILMDPRFTLSEDTIPDYNYTTNICMIEGKKISHVHIMYNFNTEITFKRKRIMTDVKEKKSLMEAKIRRWDY